MRYASWRAEGRELVVLGHRLFVHDRGGGPRTILSLHGFPTSSFDLEAVAPLVDPAVRVVAFDFLGFGASAKPWPHAYSIAEQADLTAALASTLSLGSVTLLAHDYGVSVAQELLARQREGRLPFVIERAVLMNGGVYAQLHRPLRLQRLLAGPLGPLLARFTSASAFARSMRKIAGRREVWDDARVAEHWTAICQHHGARRIPALLHYLEDRRRNAGRWEQALEHASCPLTFVWGLEDPISGAHMLDEVARRLPRAQRVPLPGIGHYPQLEAPGRVAQSLK